MNPLTGAPWSATNKIRAQWIGVLKKAGIRYRVPDQARHTYASTMLQVGENVEYVAKIMGHEDSATTLKYYARHTHRPPRSGATSLRLPLLQSQVCLPMTY